MSRKRYTPEQIIGKLREAEVSLSAMIRYLSIGLKFYLSSQYRHINLIIEGASPKGLESLSLGMSPPSSDTQIKCGTFSDEGIIVEPGKVSAILVSFLTGISYKRCYVHVAFAFPQALHYQAVVGVSSQAYQKCSISLLRAWYAQDLGKLIFRPKLC